VHRRGLIKTVFAAAAATLGATRFAKPAQAQTRHIRLYVEMEVPAENEQQLLELFHNARRPHDLRTLTRARQRDPQLRASAERGDAAAAVS
jgi:hypothetical protein